MLERAKQGVLTLARRAGYEVLKQSDPRLSAAKPPESGLDRALDTLRDHAADERVAARIFDAVLAAAVAPHHQSVFWGDRLLSLDKSASFREDPRFSAAMRAVSSNTGLT